MTPYKKINRELVSEKALYESLNYPLYQWSFIGCLASCTGFVCMYIFY